MKNLNLQGVFVMKRTVKKSISVLICICMIFYSMNLIFTQNVYADTPLVLIKTEDFSVMPEGGGSAGNEKWTYSGPSANITITPDEALQLTGDSSAVYARYEILSSDQAGQMSAKFKLRLDGLATTSKMVSIGFMSGGTSQVNETHKLTITDGTGRLRYRNAASAHEDLSLMSGGNVSLTIGQVYDIIMVASSSDAALGADANTCKIYIDNVLAYEAVAGTISPADVFRSFFIKIDSSADPALKVSIDDLELYQGAKLPETTPGVSPTPATGKAILLELDKPIAVLSVGDSDTIVPRVTYDATAILEGREKYDTDVNYVSSDPTVATVDSNGLIKAVSAGVSYITVESVLTPVVSETYTVYVGQKAPGEALLSDGTPAFKFYNPPEKWAEEATWKLQLPLVDYNDSGIAIGVSEVTPEELQNGYQSEFFYLDENGWLSFWCPVEGGKTANTSYARSELREMINPNSTSKNWGWDGTHVMEVTQKIEKVPVKASNTTSVKYGETIITQIHGIEKDGANANPLIKVRYQYNYTTGTGNIITELKMATEKNAGDNKPIFTNVPLGQEFTTVIKVINNVLYCTISTTDTDGTYREETFVHNFVDIDYRWSDLLGYYKAGNYIQDDSIDNHFGDGATHGEGAIVKIKPGSLKVYHSDDIEDVPATSINFEKNTANVSINDTIQLVPEFTPVHTTQKDVIWTVESGDAFVTISQDGTVMGKATGTAVIRCTSKINPTIYDECTVTVVSGIPISNGIPIYETDFESEIVGSTGTSVANWSLTSPVTDGSAEIAEKDGNKAIKLYDYTGANGIGATLGFPIQNDTMTITFNAMIEDIYTNSSTDRLNGTISKMYVGIGYNAAQTSLPDADQTYRMRNNGSTMTNGVSANQYWQPTNNGVSAYTTAQKNADKQQLNLGEWKEITYIITPDNSSPYKNTTRVYIDGYYIGTYQNHVGAGKANFASLNTFRFYTGTADAMTAWIDDVKVYSGAMFPTPKENSPIESFNFAAVPKKLGVGDTFQLNADIFPSSAIQDVSFSVVSGNAAVISENGLVIGTQVGTVTIEMTSKADSAKKATCTIEIVDDMIRVEKITLDSKNIYVAEGATKSINVVFTPNSATEKALSYEILSGNDIISIDMDGVITGIKSGVATVKVTSLNNSKAIADFTVSVIKPAPNEPELIYEENFEHGLITSLNQNSSTFPYWGFNLDGNTTKNTSVTVEALSDGNSALKLIDNSPGGQPTAMLKFEPTGSAVTINFNIMIADDKRDALNNVSSARVSVGNGDLSNVNNQAASLLTTGNFVGAEIENRRYQVYADSLKTRGNNVFDVSSSKYQLNVWDAVKLVVTPDDGSAKANTTEVYLNSELMTVMNNPTNQAVLDTILFHASGASLVTYYIDNIKVWRGEYLQDIPKKPNIATVSFDANGGDGIMSSVSVEKDTAYTLPHNDFSKAGYTFIGWKVANSEDVINIGTQIIVTDDIVIYAQWKKDEGNSNNSNNSSSSNSSNNSQVGTDSSKSQNKGENVNTGDRANIVIYVVFIAICISIFLMIFVESRKKVNKEK